MAKTTGKTSVEEWLDNLDPATAPARDGRYLRAISAARQAVVESEANLRKAVDEARAAGDSWTMIGIALDTSKQNAYRKFSKLTGSSRLNRPLHKKDPES